MRGVVAIRGVLLATWVQFTLMWGYIVARILTRQAMPSDYFIDNLPTIAGVQMTFLNLGMITWVIAFVALAGYLATRRAG